MGVYDIDFYGLTKYGIDSFVDYHVQPFTAKSITYGQILVEWSEPTGTWSELRLVRNRSGYPVTQNDGEIIYSAPDNNGHEFLDPDPAQGAYSYYGLYLCTDVGSDTWVRAGVCACLATKDWGSSEWLFDKLPNYFKYDTGGELTTDIFDNPYIWQFIQIFGWGLDMARTELEHTRNMNDGDLVNMTQLAALAATLGIEFSPEVTAKTMRLRVTQGTHVDREKGTNAGWRNLINIMTGWDADITVGRNLLLNDDQSSFVHPVYPNWSPYTNYATNEFVQFNGFWYKAKSGGAYGDDQKPSTLGVDNTWWFVVKDEKINTILNGQTGGQSTWEIYPLTGGIKDYDSDNSLGQGVPNVLDEGVTNANALRIENNTASTIGDFAVRSVSRLRNRVGLIRTGINAVVTSVDVDLDQNVSLPSVPFRMWIGWDSPATSEAVRVTAVTGTGPYTLTISRAQSSTTAIAWSAKTKMYVQDTAMNPNQPVRDGIPIPFVRNSKAWEADVEYSTGDIVLYGGRPYEALRASTGAQPPYPNFSEPTTEWACVGWDRRIALMLSGYTHEPFITSTKAQTNIYPFVEWYDENGVLISKIEAASGYIGGPQVKVATAAVLPNTPTYNAGAGTLISAGNNVLVIDGITPGSGSPTDHFARVLVKNQADAKQNGIYEVLNNGSVSAQWNLTRVADLDVSAEFVQNTEYYVELGNTLAGTRWYLSSTTPLVLNTNNINYTQASDYPWTYPGATIDSFTSGWGSSLAARAFDVGTNTWTQATGTWLVDGYSGGGARPSASATRTVATTTGLADTRLGVTFRTAPAAGYTQALMFRRSDDNNYWRAGRQTLRKKVAGVWTTVATWTTPFANNDRMTIHLSGSTINVYRNHDFSVAVGTTTDAFNASATIHGMLVELT